MAEKDKPKTTFTTKFGLYEFDVLTVGLTQGASPIPPTDGTCCETEGGPVKTGGCWPEAETKKRSPFFMEGEVLGTHD